MKRFLSVPMLLIFLMTGPILHPRLVMAEEKPVSLPGCYSNLAFHEQSGDLLGYEFFIVFARGKYFLLYQRSEGEPDIPLLLELGVHGNEINFTLPGQGHTFRGWVSEEGLRGAFTFDDRLIILPRKTSYWQRD